MRFFRLDVDGLQGCLLHRLIDAVGSMGIPVQIAAETRENFNVLEEPSGSQYQFVLPGPELRATEWQACLDRLASVAHAPRYVVAIDGCFIVDMPDAPLRRPLLTVAV